MGKITVPWPLITRGPRKPYTISASFGPALRYILARMPMMKISASTPSPTKRISRLRHSVPGPFAREVLWLMVSVNCIFRPRCLVSVVAFLSVIPEGNLLFLLSHSIGESTVVHCFAFLPLRGKSFARSPSRKIPTRIDISTIKEVLLVIAFPVLSRRATTGCWFLVRSP